jgi:hypothetical protein
MGRTLGCHHQPDTQRERHHDVFDDPILGNSALDRLANAAHQLVLDGPSYRARLAPKHRQQPEAGR